MANYQGDLKASAISFAQSKLLVSLGARHGDALLECITVEVRLSLNRLTARQGGRKMTVVGQSTQQNTVFPAAY